MACPGVFETKGPAREHKLDITIRWFCLFLRGLDELAGDPFSLTDRVKDIKYTTKLLQPNTFLLFKLCKLLLHISTISINGTIRLTYAYETY